jgi:chemotaxis protein CheX
MEQSFVKTFTDSTRYVLSAVSGIEPEVHEHEEGASLNSFVTGTLSLRGSDTASLSVCFSKEAIHKLHTKVFPGEESSITFSSMGDLAGEITNMICGKAREILSATGLRFYASIPKILFGDRHHIYEGHNGEMNIVHFDLDGCGLFLELRKDRRL